MSRRRKRLRAQRAERARANEKAIALTPPAFAFSIGDYVRIHPKNGLQTAQREGNIIQMNRLSSAPYWVRGVPVALREDELELIKPGPHRVPWNPTSDPLPTAAISISRVYPSMPEFWKDVGDVLV